MKGRRQGTIETKKDHDDVEVSSLNPPSRHDRTTPMDRNVPTFFPEDNNTQSNSDSRNSREYRNRRTTAHPTPIAHQERIPHTTTTSTTTNRNHYDTEKMVKKQEKQLHYIILDKNEEEEEVTQEHLPDRLRVLKEVEDGDQEEQQEEQQGVSQYTSPTTNNHDNDLFLQEPRQHGAVAIRGPGFVSSSDQSVADTIVIGDGGSQVDTSQLSRSTTGTTNLHNHREGNLVVAAEVAPTEQEIVEQVEQRIRQTETDMERRFQERFNEILQQTPRAEAVPMEPAGSHGSPTTMQTGEEGRGTTVRETSANNSHQVNQSTLSHRQQTNQVAPTHDRGKLSSRLLHQDRTNVVDDNGSSRRKLSRRLVGVLVGSILVIVALIIAIRLSKGGGGGGDSNENSDTCSPDTTCSFDHATAICTTDGQCVMGACDFNYGNCNGISTDGCEVDLQTNINHCGSCGNTCTLANANPTCVEGECEMESCLNGFSSCDGQSSTGCETNVLSSHDNCGTCNMKCDADKSCINSICVQNDTTEPPSNNTEPPSSIAFTKLKDLISGLSFDPSMEALLDPSSPQYEALEWLSEDPNLDVYEDSQKIQRFVLATLFFSTGGHDHWRKISLESSSEWLDYLPSSTDSQAECLWYTTSSSSNGDICDSNGNIVELHLQDNNLVGTIPPELALLSNSLSTLVLDQNKISGTIPTELGLLQFLERLDLSSNDLTGYIPSELGSSHFFKYVALDDNESLEGSIPLSQMCEQTIIVDCSKIYCPCCDKECLRQHISALSPDSGVALADTTSPQYEAFEWLTSLPQQENLFKMSKSKIVQRYALATLYKSTNILDDYEWSCDPNDPMAQCEYTGWLGTGDVCDSWEPISWNYYPNPLNTCDDDGLVLVLDLDEGVCCGGTIPPEIGLLTTLELFTMQLSFLSGKIPSEIGLLTNLETLDISRQDNLNGPIPSTIGRLTNLKHLNLGMNSYMAGSTLPTEVGNLVHLETFYLDYSFHAGHLPSEIGRMVALARFNLYENNMIGALPSEIGLMTSLEDVNFRKNSFSGAIPSEVGKLSSLTSLDCSYNNLSGSLPSELGLLKNLERMGLDYNYIVGNIPSTFGKLESLQWLELRNNQLVGSLPTEVGRLLGLQNLDLSRNSLVGLIPTELGVMTNLDSISLTSNFLAGNIPSELGMLTILSGLHIADNIFLGKIPSELGQLTDLFFFDVSRNELTGQIPSELGLTGFWYDVDFRYNDLSGMVPDEICQIGKTIPNFNLLVDCDELLCTCCGEECLKKYFKAISPDDGVALDTLNSPQYFAFQWLKYDSNLARFSSAQRVIERYVFATFHYSTTINNNWTCSSFDVCDMALWMTDRDICEVDAWFVYTKECNDNGLVVKLDFSDILCCGGTIPPELALLKKLEYLELDSNWLSGTLPTELGSLQSSLGHLVIKNQVYFHGTYDQTVRGNIPSEFGLLTSLSILNLESNFGLEGSIPSELGQLSKLQLLLLSDNQLSGIIPTEVSGMTSLEAVTLDSNDIADGLENFCTSDIPSLDQFVADCLSLSCWCCTTCK